MKILTYLLIMIACTNAWSQTIEYIPIKSPSNKLIIQAEINGKKSYFLVDTGSDISVINSSKLKRLKLCDEKIYDKNHMAIDANGNQTELKKVKNIKVNFTANFYYDEFYSFNIDKISESIEHKSNYRIDGIIGADVLNKYNCTIDYNTNQLSMMSQKKSFDSSKKRKVLSK